MGLLELGCRGKRRKYRNKNSPGFLFLLSYYTFPFFFPCSCPLTPTVSKASSGAMEVLDVYSTDDLRSFLKVECSMGFVFFFFFSFKKPQILHLLNREEYRKRTQLFAVSCAPALHSCLLPVVCAVGPPLTGMHPQSHSIGWGSRSELWVFYWKMAIAG